MARTLHLSGVSLSRFPNSFYRSVPLRFVATSALGLTLFGALSGCVGQDKYNALKLDRDGLAEQLSKSQADGQAAQAQADSFKSQLDRLVAGGQNGSALLSNFQQQVAQLQAENDALNKKYADALNRPMAAGAALPPALTSELQEFASAHPDIVEFDSLRGIVRFKSDVLFDAGETTLKPGSLSAISKFSEILNSPAANGYELMVAGHTDNQPVRNRATIAAGNKDNWYLSCHRAIAVGDRLLAASVSPNRIAMCGYADQRPEVPNTSAANQAQNRRVEVLILPTQVKGPAVMAAETTLSSHTTVKKIVKTSMNKDGGMSMNK